MSKKSFFFGVVTGIVLSFVILIVIGLIYQKSTGRPPVQYLEKPLSYENKSETSFQVFQVLGNSALAMEKSESDYDEVYYTGNTVLIVGENYYCNQIVTVKNPLRIGTYSYNNRDGHQKTVPVIDGEME